MRIRGWLAAGLLTALIGAAPAAATTGGPEFMEVVGYDSTEAKVFLRVEPHGESGSGPYLAYLELEARDPCHVVPVPWSRSLEQEYTRDPRWAKLAKRLAPVPLELTSSLPATRVLSTDTLTTAQGSWPRYRVRIQALRHVWMGQVDVVTYVTPAVHVPRVYRLPGKMGGLAIVAFRGIPDEEGYECHLPLLLDFTCQEAPIEWRPR